MIIKEVKAKAVLDSRRHPTIRVIVKTDSGSFKTSAPSGKSTGKYEAKPYSKSLIGDIGFINNLDVGKINKISVDKFQDLVKVERLIGSKLGANSLFALEASILKALSKENGKELYEFLKVNKKIKFPRSVGNTIGGGVHSKGKNHKNPDFQEFLFIADCSSFKECVKINKKAYKLARKLLKTKSRSDEGAWRTEKTNIEVFEIMDRIRKKIMQKYKKKIDIGTDVASSGFYKNKKYVYKNPKRKLKKNEQINYIKNIIDKYKVFYIEDPLHEDDFPGFGELLKNSRKNKYLIVGDDLTTTNPKRLKKSVKNKSINAIIVKPNQIGSLIKVKGVIDIAKKNNIKTIISHRSGETEDDTIADLCVGFGCDLIKTGIYSKVREAKLKRLIRIEKKIKWQEKRKSPLFCGL